MTTWQHLGSNQGAGGWVVRCGGPHLQIALHHLKGVGPHAAVAALPPRDEARQRRQRPLILLLLICPSRLRLLLLLLLLLGLLWVGHLADTQTYSLEQR